MIECSRRIHLLPAALAVFTGALWAQSVPGTTNLTPVGKDGRPLHRGYTPQTRGNAPGSDDPLGSLAEPAPETAGGTLTITTTSCPGGTQGAAYAGCTIAATGGTPPYQFSVDTTSGNYPTLPEGLALNATTGAITSTQIGGQGAYQPNIIVKDSAGNQATARITFAINGNNAFAASIFPVGSILRHRVDAATTALPVDTSPAAPIYSGYLPESLRVYWGNTSDLPWPNGIPMFEVPYNQPDVNVATTVYQSYYTSAPIPANAPIEGTSVSVASGGDGHVLIYREAGGGNPPAQYEMWQGIYEGGSWTCSSNALWTNVTSYAMTPQGNGTTDAAGLPVAPLLLNADEVIGTGTPAEPNGVVQHPTRFTLNHTLNYWVWPSTQSAGQGYCTVASGSSIPDESEIAQSVSTSSSSVPYPTYCSFGAPAGEIYRLKASVAMPSCAATSPQAKIIITGLRNYGIIVADNGNTGALIGTPDARWNDSDLSCLTNLTLSDFEPVNVSSLMIGTDSFQTNTSPTLSQTIAFNNPGSQVIGTPLPLVATSSSGLPVQFASETTSVCTVSGRTATFIAAGTCTIEATQAGDSSYEAATPVSESFQVTSLAGGLQPSISSITPNPVLLNQVTVLTVNGSNFQSGFTASVTVGGVTYTLSAGGLGFVSSSQVQIWVVMGGSSAYTATLNITNPGGLTASQTFPVASSGGVQPSITSIAPNPVLLNQVTTLTVNGGNFQSGFTASVTIGGMTYPLSAAGLGFVSSSQVQIWVVMGGASAYTATLNITNPGGLTASRTFPVASSGGVQPTIASITPNPVPLNTATTLTVNGSNFQSGFTASVTIGGVTYPLSAAGLGFVSSSQVQIWVVMGGTSAYTATLNITNPGGLTASQNFQVGPN